MRALLGLTIGVVLVAFAAGMIPLEDDRPPLFFNIVFAVMGALVVLASLAHLRLRWRRRLAYSGGREKHGVARLAKPPGEDASTATIVFASAYREWILTVDLSSIAGLEDQLREGAKATAYLGEDDRIYGLDIGQRRTLPISSGVEMDPAMQERLSRSRERAERYAAKSSRQKV